MQKVFETVQCASRWSGASLAGSASDLPDGPAPASRLLHKPPSNNDSMFDDIGSDTDSEDYP